MCQKFVLFASRLEFNLKVSMDIRCVSVSVSWHSTITLQCNKLAHISGKNTLNKSAGLNWATSAIMAMLPMSDSTS